MGVHLDASRRERLAALADALIPGGEGLPAASTADVQGKWIDRTLAARPDLGPLVEAALALEGEPEAALRAWRSREVESHDGFALTVCGAYLLNPRVRKLLGYEGPAPRPAPAFPDESDLFLEGGLIDPVVARGPVYRPVPQDAA
jgi:hypothetical protein